MIFYIYSRYAVSDKEAMEVVKSWKPLPRIINKLCSWFGMKPKIHDKEGLMFPLAIEVSTGETVFDAYRFMEPETFFILYTGEDNAADTRNGH